MAMLRLRRFVQAQAAWFHERNQAFGFDSPDFYRAQSGPVDHRRRQSPLSRMPVTTSVAARPRGELCAAPGIENDAPDTIDNR
jgi:hypothetical protein